jgi:CMP-N-acetylneuraminic acid synthetase
MSVIAIIPARGGSKRLPGKNILDFFGKPMIAWTIKAAVDSGIFDKILVSTDDEKIAQIARYYGADVPFLRISAADDFSPISNATLSALDQAENHWKQKYNVVVQLMANCPMRRSEEILIAMQAFKESGAKFQISCFPFGWMNPWWAAKLDESGIPEVLFPSATGVRSQDLPQLYCPSGAIWIADAAALKHDKTFYGNGHRYHPIHWTAAIDIDDTDDFDMARAVFAMRNSSSDTREY